MKTTRIYRHEDTGMGAKVFYNVFLRDIETSKPSLSINIEKMQYEIYHNSKRTKVIVPPDITKLTFSFKETHKFMGLLIEAISSYMAAIREKLYFTNTLKMEMELENSDYSIIFYAVNKKTSHAGKEKNSARLILNVIDKKTGEDVISIKLKKTKIIILLQIIKALYEQYINKFTIGYENIEDERVPIIRIDDNVAIGDIWIHGREIQKFQDYIERVIFDFKFKTGDGKEMFRYRQVSSEFSASENVALIKLTKYTKDNKVFLDDFENTREHKFLVNSYTAAVFYLTLPKAIAFDLDDIEVYAVDYDKEKAGEEDKTKVIDPYYITQEVDKKEVSSIEEGDFILNTIENQMILQVNNKKFNAKNRVGKITLAVRYRDHMIDDENYVVGRTNRDTQEFEVVRKLPKCVIDLKIDWLYIFSLCVESIHSIQEMDTNEHGNHAHSWRFSSENIFGGDHYGIRIVCDPKNKAPAVMLIDHHIDDDGELKNSPLPSTGGARMRIPLFKEHIRTLLKGLVGLSVKFDNYYWSKKMPVYSDDYDCITGEMNFGLRRFTKKGESSDVVSLGIIGKSSKQIYLTDSDRDTLFFSAYYRLMYGRWLQFSGEQISVSFDGWLTDRFNEYKIEFDLESSSGARGSLPALAMLFATARGKNKIEKIKEADASLDEVNNGKD